MSEVSVELEMVKETKGFAMGGASYIDPHGSGVAGLHGSGEAGLHGSGEAGDRSRPTFVLLGREMFQHAFMAVDYLECRFTDVKLSLGVRSKPRSLKVERFESPQESFESSRSKGIREYLVSERGDVPGWVLVVLMTTGLVTAIWAVAAPKLNAILKNSLDSMNNIR